MVAVGGICLTEVEFHLVYVTKIDESKLQYWSWVVIWIFMVTSVKGHTAMNIDFFVNWCRSVQTSCIA